MRPALFIHIHVFSAVPEYVIKAQILAGGRGKGTFDNGFKGGVHLTKKWVARIRLNNLKIKSLALTYVCKYFCM